MKAFQTKMFWQGGVGLYDVARPVLKEGQVLVKIIAAGLNRRDLKIKEGRYFRDYTFDSTLGSDGVGEVVEVANKNLEHWLGKQVLINPVIDWGDEINVPSDKFTILGMPTDGTFSEFVSIDATQIYTKPKHLSNYEAAALSLAGLTAYRVIFEKAKIHSNQDVLVTGAGGGVAQMVIKFLLAIGVNVWVTSSSQSKIDAVKSWGVTQGVNYTNPEWIQQIGDRKFDVVIDAAGGSQVNDLLSLLKHNGKFVFYGATNGAAPQIHLSTVYYNQLQIIGSLLGNNQEFEEMLAFVLKHKIKPEVDSVYSYKQIQLAFDKMANFKQFGKIIIEF